MHYRLGLPEAFPLNMSECALVFPPADWPAPDVLTALGSGGDRPCLILGQDPAQAAELSRRCRSPETWWVAPEDGELSALLLAAEPLEAFARLIARYVKVGRISPYQTSQGVHKESGFFGRTRILSDILNREPANYLLVGGRQLGKSSLLQALKRRFAQTKGIDCHYLSVGKEGIERRLASALNLPLETPWPGLLARLGEPDPGTRRVLLLDEADVFVARDGAAGYPCLHAFRSLSEEGRCQFSLAGFWTLYRAASFDYQSPLKNFAEIVQVGALEPDACRELATRPMQALGLSYDSDALVERILERTGGRANLVAILCNEMLQGLGLAQRSLSERSLAAALASFSIRKELESWRELTTDPQQSRLDRLIVYGLIERETFGLGDVLDLLGGLGCEAAPQRIRESLTRLELAFLIGRSSGEEAAGSDGHEVTRYRWQVPLWRDRVLADKPGRMLEGELGERRESPGGPPGG